MPDRSDTEVSSAGQDAVEGERPVTDSPGSASSGPLRAAVMQRKIQRRALQRSATASNAAPGASDSPVAWTEGHAPATGGAGAIKSQVPPTGAKPEQAAVGGTFTPHAQLTTTQDGKPGEPINLYLHGSLPAVKAAIKAAGFTEALPQGLSGNMTYIGEAAANLANRAEQNVADAAKGAAAKAMGAANRLLGRAQTAIADPKPLPQEGPQAVDNMPISMQFLDGKPMVAAFSQGNDPLAGRHHFRLFDTGQTDAEGREVWAISASHDTGIVFDKNRPKQAFMNHAVEANTDGERDYVAARLAAGGQTEGAKKIGGMEFGPAGYYGDTSVDQSVIDAAVKEKK